MIVARNSWPTLVASLLLVLPGASCLVASEPLGRAVGSTQFAVTPDLSSWLRRACLSKGSELPLGTWQAGPFEAAPLGGLLQPAEDAFTPLPPSIVDRLVAPANYADELDLVAPAQAAARPAASPPEGAREDNAGTDEVRPEAALPPGREDTTPSAEKAERLKDRPSLPTEEAPRIARQLDEPKRPEPPAANQELSPEMAELKKKLRKCLDTYYRQQITNGEYSPWGIMHVLIAFGCDSEIYAADHRVSTAGWLCWNGSCRGMRLLYSTENGRFAVRQGAGYQGHPGQLLAILAQSRVAIDYEMRVDGKKYTVADLIEYEKRTCRERTELTFKLIGLTHYLSSDATWNDDRGVEWSIPKLIKEELAQPVIGAACGGTHRLTGLAYAVRNRERTGGELTGPWLKARKYLNDYHAYTFKLQNPDGSFSANWFEGRGSSDSIDRRLQTTGHILEWLVYSLPAEELDDPRVVKAVNLLVDLMQTHSYHKWEVGPRGHAIHALNLYDRRRFGAKMGERSLLARQAAPQGASAQTGSPTPGQVLREFFPRDRSGEPAADIPATAERPSGSIRLRR